MTWRVQDVISARQTLGKLFEELRLADYLYGVEAQEQGWLVRVECRCRAGSYSTSFGLQSGVLERAQSDMHARRRLRRFLSERLGDCTRAARPANARPAEPDPDEDDGPDLASLGGLSEFSSTAGGMQPSRPSSVPPPPVEHPVSYGDGPDTTRDELYWYALEQATQDPHPPLNDLEPAEEAALHVQGGTRRD